MSKQVNASITKEKIARLLQVKLGFSALVCEEIVNVFFNQLLNTLLTDGKLVLTNFGKFEIYTKNPRSGINLQTGKAVIIDSRKVLRFNAAKSFRNKVNLNESKK